MSGWGTQSRARCEMIRRVERFRVATSARCLIHTATSVPGAAGAAPSSGRTLPVSQAERGERLGGPLRADR